MALVGAKEGATNRMRDRYGKLLGLLALWAGLGVVPASAIGATVSFQLTSAAGGPNLPFTLGEAFRQGDVPNGSNLTGSIATLQVVPKNQWPDGSLKYAIVSGRISLASNAPTSVSLSIGSPSGGTALTTADLRATNITASIGAGSFGTASWSGADFDAPFASWVSGPEMSSWVYRKPIGGDAHLVGWMEVRLYAGGAVEVLPWVENGYILVAGPTDKNAIYSFTLGGSQRFSQSLDLLNHQRVVLASGSTFAHWLGTDPQIVPKHDVAYLQSSKLVPSYSGTTSSGSSLWSRVTQAYTPLGQGDYRPAPDMHVSGYHGSIGPLPEWDVAYLTSGGDPRAYKGIIVNAYNAGWFGIHFRDETTNRPPRFSAYPHLVIASSSNSGIAECGASSTGFTTPTASGATPAQWDTAHSPSIGYMAYLVTGRFYFMEETEFAASVNFLKNNDAGAYGGRQGVKGIMQTDVGALTTRGAAWALRTLIQAANVAPDADPLHAEYTTSFEENVNYYHQLFIVTPNNNPQGVCAPYSNYNGTLAPFLHSMWMEDFLTFAFAYGKEIMPLSASAATKLDAFMVWKYKSIVGRFGGGASTEYCYRDAAPYTMAVSPSATARWDGTTNSWYANWGENYVATMGHANDCNTGTDLRGTSGSNPVNFTGYWGNLLPALAYAVDAGAAGAATAYARFTGASNYPTGEASLDDLPVWGVRPRTSGSPPPSDTTPPNPPGNLQAR